LGAPMRVDRVGKPWGSAAKAQCPRGFVARPAPSPDGGHWPMSDDDRPSRQRGLLRGQPERPGGGRERSLANLQRGRTTHGAFNAAMVAPLEEEHQQRLRAEFPGAAQTPGGDDLINSCARRLAMLDRYSAFVSDSGPLRAHGGRAEVQPAAREARVLLDAHERSIERLMALEREHGGAGGQTLAQVEAELIAAGDGQDGDEEDQ